MQSLMGCFLTEDDDDDDDDANVVDDGMRLK